MEQKKVPAIKERIRDLIRNPKKLIPTGVLALVWIALSLLSGLGVNVPFTRALDTVTYSNGGMYGGIAGTIGGIFGKAVFAAFVTSFVNALTEKKNPLKGIRGGLKGIFADGISAVCPFLVGIGTGLILYWFFNITSSPVNCAIAAVGALTALIAAGKRSGLLFSAIFGVMSKLTRGKTPSYTSVSRIVSGMAAGFAVGLPLTFFRYGWLILTVGIVVIAGAVTFEIIRKNKSKSVAAAMTALLFTATVLYPFFAFAAGNESYTLVISPFYKENKDEYGYHYDDWDSLMYYSFYRAGEITVSENGGGNFGFTLPGFDYSYQNDNDVYSVTVPEMVFSGNTFTESGGTYNAEFTAKTGDGIFITYFRTRTTTGEVFETIHELKTFVLRLGFTKWDISDGSINVHSSNSEMKKRSYKEGVDLDTVYYGGCGHFSQGFTLTGFNTDLAGSSEDGDGTDTYKKYKGHLTYKNGAKNKYGQPFPDIMDFDGDGEIGWGDYEIRKELSHNPDYLDQPDSAGEIVLISILTSIIGAMAGTVGGTAGAVGAIAGEAAAETAADIFEGNPYINRDGDGDINVKDPVTGEMRLYTSNGDGTYTNPLTGATYSEQELAESVGSRAENADVIAQDEKTKNEAISSQREDNQGLSDYAYTYSKEKADQEAQTKKEDDLDKMWLKYGGERGDAASIKTAAEEAQKKEQERADYWNSYGDRMEFAEKAATVTVSAADTGVDILSNMTGTAGKIVKNVYTVGKNTASRLSDAMVNADPNASPEERKTKLMGAVAMAGFDSIADIGVNQLEAIGCHVSGNAAGDVFKNGMQNLYDGKDFTDGMIQSAVTGSAKGSLAKLGDLAVGNSKDLLKEQMKHDANLIKYTANSVYPEKSLEPLITARCVTIANNLHAIKVSEAISTAAVDTGKTVIDGVGKAYGEIKKEISGGID